ncbi:nitrate reductase [Cohaesibacter intestini]|uniref:nitrate reductase n=1 Tax=Cohaesibacter intestini TaxID=2211145 RepID=UPI001FE0BAF9|nr:nitrate reductase [Cohaesibacter intestini]
MTKMVATAEETTTRSTCPYCGVGCGVLIRQGKDGSVKVKGDPDHPANYGRLCSKGTALADTIGLEERLLSPEMNGKQVTWDKALDHIANRFNQIITDYGPDAIAFYVSGQILTEDYYAANKLMKGVIGSANIDTNSRLCMASSVAGHKRAFGADTVPGCYEDLEQADLIVLTGTNLAWCHPVLYQRIFAAKQKNPDLTVVLIDPRRTRTADLADLHLAIRPDGDVALFLGLLQRLAASPAYHATYVADHVNGMETALAAANALTPEAIRQATGLSERDLEAFYSLFVKTEKVVTVYSQGVNQSSCGTDKVNAIINCHLATGRIGRPGMGPFSVTGQPNAMGGREVGGLANMLACHMDIENDSHRALVGDFWQTDRLPHKPGLKAIDLFQAVGDGKIKALWIMATNPVDSMPDADAVRAAIKACPLVIVSDVQDRTDTLDLADIKLPSLAWGEKAGSVTNSERCISRQRSFLPAPGAAKADWWQMAEVGRRMGHGALFPWQNAADIFSEYAALSQQDNDGSRDFDIGAWAGRDAADYDAMQPFYWPQTEEKPSSSKATRFFSNGNFFTPDRRARAIDVALPKQLKAVGKAGIEPLILNTGRVRDHWHTMTRTARSARLSAHLAEPFCELSPEDAKARGITDASLVSVSNDRGEIVVRALITDRVRPGEVFVPIHWTDQVSAKARVDVLIPPVTDPFSGQPASKSARVTLTPAPIQSYGFAILRDKPVALALPYWAIAKCKDGWRVEFALSERPAAIAPHQMAGLFDLPSDASPLVFLDQRKERMRLAQFEGDQLVAAIFLAAEPVSVSRDFAAGLLDGHRRTFSERAQVLASAPSAALPDKGKIVCACMQVGQNEIAAAIAAGCQSTDAVGAMTRAGTNCGSCKPEIAEMLHDIAAE